MKTYLFLLLPFFYFNIDLFLPNLINSYPIIKTTYNCDSNTNVKFQDVLLINFCNDSSKTKNKYKLYFFDSKLYNNKMIDIDSLIKKYKNEFEIHKYLNENFLKRFDEIFPKLREEFPKFDKKQLEEFLDYLDKSIRKDSLLNKFKHFRNKNLLKDIEIIEI